MTALAFPKHKRIHDRAYLILVATLPCCAPTIGTNADEHMGIIVAHHTTGAGMALKADDTQTMPLCTRHHNDLHALCGVFARWTKAMLKQWQREMAAATWEALKSFRPGDFVDGREVVVTVGVEVMGEVF